MGRNRALIAGCLLIEAVMATVPRAHGQEAAESQAAGAPSVLPDTVRFTTLSNRDGLSQVSVHAMMQDRQGFMYFGTKDGLNRYNGHEFEIFRQDPRKASSLSNNWVLTLHEDRSGILWIGTHTGLDRFDPVTGRFTHLRHDPGDPESLSPGAVYAIAEDGSGFLWIGTPNGLNRLRPDGRSFSRYLHDPVDPQSLSHDTVRALLTDRAGTLWIGTENGLNRLDRLPAGKRFTYFPRPGQTGIDNLHEDASGDLWIGTRDGLFRFDPVGEVFSHYRHEPDDPHSLSHDEVWAILGDRRGSLWIGTRAGLDRFDPAGEAFTHFRHEPADPDSLSFDHVLSLYEDRSGNLWVGTAGGGVSRCDPSKEGFVTYRHDPGDSNSLSYDTVFALHEDRSRALWIGTHTGGLDRLDPTRKHFTHYRHSPSDPGSLGHDEVWTVYEDRAGNLWIGTKGGGLNRFDPTSERFSRFRHDPNDPRSLSSDEVLAITEERSGALWIGTEGGGLNRFDPTNKRFTRFRHRPDDPQSLSHDEVWALQEDRSGTLWIGTARGLNRFDPADGLFVRYLNDPDNPKSLGHDFIWDLYEDRSGILWIGTAGGGLDRFDPSDGTFTHLTEAGGLSNNSIYKILEDDLGRLWLSTNHGLTRFDPETGRLTAYDVNDGLQDNEFNWDAGCLGADGTMYFGGVGGFNAFRTADFPDDVAMPPVVLTSFKIFDQEADLGRIASYLEKIELSYREAFFSFEFAALDFVNLGKSEYVYMLEGLDRNWIEAGTRRYANYTNVAPGEYVFRVRSSRRGGSRGEETTVRVVLPPPPWKSWWALTFYALVLAAATWEYSAAQRRKLERERAIATRERAASHHLREAARVKDEFQRELENQVAERTAELRAAQTELVRRERLAALGQMMTTINHELRNPLGAMRVALFSITAGLDTEENRIRKAVDILDRNIVRCDQILDVLLDFSDSGAAASEPVAVDEWLYEVLAEQDFPPGVTVRRELSLPGLAVSFDRDRLRRAFVNICRNACQAMAVSPVEGERSKEGSILTVRTRQTEDRVEIAVADNGCGIPPDILPRIFEPLFSTRNFGVGLGLTIAREILTRHRGGIEVETEPDRGTRMTLWLPLSR